MEKATMEDVPAAGKMHEKIQPTVRLENQIFII